MPPFDDWFRDETDEIIAFYHNSWNSLVASYPIIFQYVPTRPSPSPCLSCSKLLRVIESDEDPPNTGIQTKILDICSLASVPATETSMIGSDMNASVIVNIREIVSRVSDVFWNPEKASLGCSLQSFGCDILWIFQKIGILFVETHHRDGRQGSEPLLLCCEDLFPSTERNGESSSQNPTPRDRNSQHSRQKKRITPTILPATNPVSSCVSPLLPYLCHASDDYSIIADPELPPVLLACDHHRLTRYGLVVLLSSLTAP
jgi:hypothetical protein